MRGGFCLFQVLLDRLQCFFSSFRPGWSALSSGQLNPRQPPLEQNKELSFTDGGRLGNTVLKSSLTEDP